MKIWKYSGLMLIITGILHTILALLAGGEAFMEIYRNNGIFNSIAGDNYFHQTAFWFLICGVFLIPFGQTLHYYQKREQKPAPLSLGYSLLILSILGCIVMPVSGFWLFLPQALIIIIANKRHNIN